MQKAADVPVDVVLIGRDYRAGRISCTKKVLLAYVGSIEGRRALREGARIAELSAATAAVEVGFVMPITEEVEIFEKILAEGVERLKALGFTPTASLSIGEAGREYN